MPWQRAGYCCRCGECCNGTPGLDGASDLMKRPPPVPGKCPLYEIRDGLGTCIGHTGFVPAGEEDPYYMAGCNIWPDAPHHIENFPSCTYTFTWVD